MGLVALHCQFRHQFPVCRMASLPAYVACNSARIIVASSMTNRKGPRFAWVFSHWKRCAGKLPKKHARIWNSLNSVPHPPLIPPPVPLSEWDKGGGRVSSSLVGEGSFRANTTRIWVGAIHELPLQVVT